MNTLIKTARTLAVLIAVFAVPHFAFAAKKFNTLTPVPASTNVTAGVATNVSSVFSLVNGTGGTAVGNGSNCFFSFLISPADPNVTASLSVTNFTTQTVSPTQNVTLTVSFGASAPSNTYIITVFANNNPSNQTFITTISNTYTITMASAPPGTPLMVWTPAGANINWATANNWAPNGPPNATNDVLFDDLGTAGSAGVVDNMVTAGLTIGSLTYGQTNLFHTTQINSGMTLTVTGTNGLAAGTGTDIGNVVTANAITGAGGTLVVSNTNANVVVDQSHAVSGTTASATLDMSGLDTFRATVGRMLVGADTLIKGASGNLLLAKTNSVTATVGSTAPQLDVGENTQASGITGASSSMLLGMSNVFLVDSIAVGKGRVQGGSVMAFNSAFVSPAALFRGTGGGANRVSTWSIGDAATGKSATVHGTNDFSLGTVDAMVNTMFVGVGAVATDSTVGNGALIYNSGKFDVNTLEIGYSSSTNNGTGTVSVTGGTLIVNTLLELAHSPANTNNGTGTLNASSGATITANSGITAGGGNSSISLSGSTLNVTNASATIGTPLSPLSSLAVTNSTLNVAIQLNSPTVSVTNLAADTAPNTINATAVPLLTGFPTQFPVIQYATASGDLTTFVMGTLPSASPAYVAFISNNVANNSIDIVFTAGPSVPALTWAGTPNGNWDLSTTNWRPKTGPNTFFAQSNFVTFDDTLTGTATVNLTTTLIPGSLTVSNNSANYVFTGSGGIGGNVTLIKTNTGTLVLDNGGNTSTGGVLINQGTVQVGNSDGLGTLPGGAVDVEGTLTFKRNDSITVTNDINGGGALIQNSPLQNTLTLNGNGSFSGAATVAQGTLQLGSTNGLGAAGSITVNSGATFDVNGFALFGNGNSGLVVTASGPGVGNNGAIVNNTTNNLTKVFHVVTLAADTTFGGTGNWDIRNSLPNHSPVDGQLNGAFNLTKVGTNAVALNNIIVDPGLKNISVQAGTLTFSSGTTSLGDASFTATVFTNATLTLDTLSNTVSKLVVLNDGATLKGSSVNGSGGPVTLTGQVTVTGSATVNTSSNSLLQLNNPVVGTGSLTKTGAGVVFLAASNTYGGSTTVSGGTLALTNNVGVDSSINASTNINVTSGATLDVTGRVSDGTLTLVSGQTLSGGIGTNGPGVVRGILVAGGGSFVAPGNITNTGTLGVSSNATLQGATIMKVNPTNGTSDQLAANSLTYGGTLTVTSLPGSFTNGEIFQLFVATNGVYNAASFGSVTLPSAPGLTWTNNLSVNGTIVASVVAPSQPGITHISLSGTTLTLTGTNGTAGFSYTVKSSTNVTLARSLWSPVTNSTFSGGNFSLSFTVNPNTPQTYFLLSIP